ncbi:MAG: ATP-binding protein [Myxococcota bacterium]
MTSLAEANVNAAQLVAELDEAQASRVSLERRTDELTLQTSIDGLVAEMVGDFPLCAAFLEKLLETGALMGTGEPSGIILIRRHGVIDEVMRRGSVPGEVNAELKRRLRDGSRRPGRLDGVDWYAIPVVGRDRLHGMVGLAVVATPDWVERWHESIGLLGRGVGRALERYHLDLERQRIALELEKARDEALAASMAKSTFLANISHEVRTPLNAIIGYSEMIREEAIDDGHDHYVKDLDKIIRASRHLLGLINDVLDLSKIEAGKMEVKRGPFRVHALVEDVVMTADVLARANGNRLVVEITEGVDAMVGDSGKLRQCLINLLGNAAKFTTDGTVTLRVSRRGDRYRFTVKDTGVGMRADELGRIFEAFQQADAGRSQESGGTGLGLAVTERLCRMMDGSIEVASEEGVGTQFNIDLPVVLLRTGARSLVPKAPS